jgi:hypothetical protein
VSPYHSFPLLTGYSLHLGKVPGAAWKQCASDVPVFFTPDYLRALEHSDLKGFSYLYGEVYKGSTVAGLIYFQVIDLSFVKIGSVIHSEPYGRFMKLVSEKISTSLFGRRRDKKHFLLVNGNMCASGEYGIFFYDEHKQVLPDIYKEIYKVVESFLEKEGDISAAIIKDFHFNTDVLCKPLTDDGFIRFVMDPVMTLYIKPEWKNFDDYLQALSSKYRLRAATAISKTEEYTLRELSQEDIEKDSEKFDHLYQAVISKSPIRIVQTDIRYIIELKKNLKDNFIVKGWFKDDEPAAFFTAFNFNGVTEAHHIGIDYHLNRTHALYQNILYKLIDIAIANQSAKLDYGRTAMEMKSTVGAVPENYAAYLRMSSRIMNHLVKPFLPATPPAGWVQRDPFRNGDLQ